MILHMSRIATLSFAENVRCESGGRMEQVGASQMRVGCPGGAKKRRVG